MVHPFMAYSFRVYYFCAIWIACIWYYLLDSFVTHSSSLEICNLTGDHNAIPQIMLIFIFV